MGMSKKGMRKIIRNDRVFYWCVKNDEEDEDRLHLVIKSDDKKFIVSYALGQRETEHAFIIVRGNEFKGLNYLSGTWERFLVPEWDDEIVTPSLVAKIIDWCFAAEDVISVNCRGEII